MKTLIIIPAYNESDSIESVVTAVVEAGYDYVVINDGSTDDTLDKCTLNNFNVIDLPRNLGIGGAVQTGHKFALDNNYDVDIQFDGDGQHDLEAIPLLIQSIENGADLAIGSRFLEETDGFKSTLLRRMGIRWLSALIGALYHSPISDPTSGFRACGKNAIKLFSKTYPIDYPEPESIAEALNHGLKVSEVPVVMHERQGGSSSIKALSSIYYMIKVSLSIVLCSFHRS